jgi:hypothetical protein
MNKMKPRTIDLINFAALVGAATLTSLMLTLTRVIAG